MTEVVHAVGCRRYIFAQRAAEGSAAVILTGAIYDVLIEVS